MADTRKNASKTSGRGSGRPFEKGNPGRPRGARCHATQMIETLFEDRAGAIGEKCIERALEGDGTALRLVMERVAPLAKADRSSSRCRMSARLRTL
jgi:hypothetical protein